MFYFILLQILLAIQLIILKLLRKQDLRVQHYPRKYTWCQNDIPKALMMAVQDRNIKAIDYFLDIENADIDFERRSMELFKYVPPPIHIASTQHALPIVKYLANRGANLDSLQRGRTALYYAVQDHHHTDIVRFLAFRGADVSMIDCDTVAPEAKEALEQGLGYREVCALFKENQLLPNDVVFTIGEYFGVSRNSHPINTKVQQNRLFKKFW